MRILNRFLAISTFVAIFAQTALASETHTGCRAISPAISKLLALIAQINAILGLI